MNGSPPNVLTIQCLVIRRTYVRKRQPSVWNGERSLSLPPNPPYQKRSPTALNYSNQMWLKNLQAPWKLRPRRYPQKPSPRSPRGPYLKGTPPPQQIHRMCTTTVSTLRMMSTYWMSCRMCCKGSTHPSHSHMSQIASWNVRGLNWPNKQEDVKLLLQFNNIGLVGLLETKIKRHKVEYTASNIFCGWDWVNNYDISNGRIWVAWKPSSYTLTILEKTDQLIHCEATQLSTCKHFHITFIYGHNLELQRQSLWDALHHISRSTQGAWCILGDFNTILPKDDRLGGNEVSDHDIQEMSNFMGTCEVQEMSSFGAHFTWTNKTIWSKINRVLINSWWHEDFDFTLAKTLPQGLPDHTSPLI